MSAAMGDVMNERADRLATAARLALGRAPDVGCPDSRWPRPDLAPDNPAPGGVPCGAWRMRTAPA